VHASVVIAIDARKNDVCNQYQSLSRLLVAALYGFFVWVSSVDDKRNFTCSVAVLGRKDPVLSEEQWIANDPQPVPPTLLIGVGYKRDDCLRHSKPANDMYELILALPLRMNDHCRI
jgi:hypothetical protein